MGLEFRRRVSTGVLVALCALPISSTLCAAMCPGATQIARSMSPAAHDAPACHAKTAPALDNDGIASGSDGCASHRAEAVAAQATAADTKFSLGSAPASLVAVVVAGLPQELSVPGRVRRSPRGHPPAPALSALVLRI